MVVIPTKASVVVVLLCCASAVVQTRDGRFFVDETGRVVFFHGVNVVYKVPPFIPDRSHWSPQLSLTDKDIDDLASWGINMVRLGVMWPGVMPDPSGAPNSTYLSEMNELVTALGKAGIRSLVDCHQDVLSRFFCGEGAPDWTIRQDNATWADFPWPVHKPYAVDERGYPSMDDCLKFDFSLYYVTARVGENFQALYENKHGFQDQFVAYWSAVAAAFKDNEHVLGYELLNEPSFGNVLQNPEYLFNGTLADERNLVPMYERLASTIRDVDKDHLLFFEPTVTNVGPAGVRAPLGDRNGSVLSYHVYCPLSDSHSEPSSLLLCDDVLDTLQFDDKMRDLERLGVAGFMTEFGAESNYTKALESLTFQMDQCEKHLQSYAYWQFKSFKDLTTDGGPAESFYDAQGQLEVDKVAVLSRTYAQAVAGLPTAMSFDRSNGYFNVSFVTDPTIRAPTEIFVSPFYYGDGNSFAVSVAPAGAATWKMDGKSKLLVVPTSQTPQHITITISNKN